MGNIFKNKNMKSLENKTLYRDIKKMNQSSLKILLKDAKLFKATIDDKVPRKDEDYLTLGTAVDVLLTEGLSSYNKQFVVVKSMPSESIKNIIDALYEKISTRGEPILNIEDYSKDIELLCNEYSYQTNWKLETRINKIHSLGSKYFEFLKKSQSKIKISVDDNLKALKCYEIVVKDWFYKDLLSQGEVIYKEIVEWVHKGVEMKSELDLIIKNDQDKTIIPVDIKTTSAGALSFMSNFWKYRYDFQSASYVLALKYKYPGYTILPFRFVVVGTQFITDPIIYEVSSEVNEIGLNGGTRTSGYKLEGFNDAVDRYLWHLGENLWSFPKQYYEQKHLKIEI